jgi:hypothetical protein
LRRRESIETKISPADGGVTRVSKPIRESGRLNPLEGGTQSVNLLLSIGCETVESADNRVYSFIRHFKCQDHLSIYGRL